MYQAPVPCAAELVLSALAGVPRLETGADVAEALIQAMEQTGFGLAALDVLVVTSKLFSRAHGRWVNLAEVQVSAAAHQLAHRVSKDPALVQCILQESTQISRTAPGVLIVRHRLGFVSANAGIDASNACPRNCPPNGGPYVLLLPEDPDGDARELRKRLSDHFGVPLGVVISDSHGRPFRVGSVGTAIGVSGLPPLWDQRGRTDLDGKQLTSTLTAVADQVAAAADLVAGQADEGRPVVRVRGLHFKPGEYAAGALLRAPAEDLYA